MATVNNELLIKIKADLGRTLADVDKLAGGIEGTGKSAKSANAAVGSLTKSFAGFLSVYAAIDAVKGLVNITAQFDAINKSLQATTGSAAGAERALATVRATANQFGLDLKGTASAYAQFNAAAAGTALEGEKAEKIFQAVAKASGALGLSMADAHGALTAIGQMMSKGSVQAEELRGQLGERLPGAFNIMARALGVSTAELNKMLDAGEVGIDALVKFSDELDKSYDKARFDDIQSSINRISTAWDTLVASAGKAVKLEVILKAVADTVAPEAINPYVEKTERANTLKSMINRREAFGVDASEYRKELEGINKELEALDRKYEAGKRLSGRFGTAQAFYDEADGIIAQGQKLADTQALLNKGQADATERLWKKTREEIEAADKAAASAAKSLQSSFESARSGLEKEIALRGENTEAAKMEYEVQFGAFRGLSEAQKLKLLNLAAEKDAVNANIEAYKEYDDILSASEKLALKQRQDMDKYGQAVAELRRNVADFSGGNISQTGFNSLLAKIQDTAQGADQKALFDELGRAFNDGFITPAKYGTNELSEFSIQAARNIQSSFADFLFDPFANGTASMVDNFAKALRRMMAEAASAQIFNALLGKDFGKSGELGGLLGSLGTAIMQGFNSGGSTVSVANGNSAGFTNAMNNLFVSTKHTGGIVGEPSAMRAFDAAIFNTAPRYHTGGIAGLMPNEVPTVLTKGEEVLTTDDPRHRNNLVAAAGNVEVNIYNQADGARASATQRQTSQGTQIDILVEQVENAMGQNIARGTGLAPVMEKQYGLNRAAGSF